MIQPETIEHAPPEVNHTGLTAGIPWDIWWGLSHAEPPFLPFDITGEVAVLRLGETAYTLDTLGPAGEVHFRKTAAQTAAFQWSSLPYVLLLSGLPIAVGRLSIGFRIAP